jgi:hypothetical protein
MEDVIDLALMPAKAVRQRRKKENTGDQATQVPAARSEKNSTRPSGAQPQV